MRKWPSISFALLKFPYSFFPAVRPLSDDFTLSDGSNTFFARSVCFSHFWRTYSIRRYTMSVSANRNFARSYCKADLMFSRNKDGDYNRAKMLNCCINGICFETDSALPLGNDICIKMVNHEPDMEYKLPVAEFLFPLLFRKPQPDFLRL